MATKYRVLHAFAALVTVTNTAGQTEERRRFFTQANADDVTQLPEAKRQELVEAGSLMPYDDGQGEPSQAAVTGRLGKSAAAVTGPVTGPAGETETELAEREGTQPSGTQSGTTPEAAAAPATTDAQAPARTRRAAQAPATDGGNA